MNHHDNCVKATAAVKALSMLINPRFYPNFHFAPPAGWINDPNGLIYFKGQYHLFYQHYPYSGYRGPMHWGHAVSDDLIRWQHLPVALSPGDEGDMDGVYSGTAIDNDGILTLFYTGHTVIQSDDDGIVVRQVQMMATSEDGIHFTKRGIIIEPPTHIQHFRDPKVWRENDIWNMVVGVSDNNIGQVWLYQSQNLTDWSFESVLHKANQQQGWMWECPDFFELNGKWVLIVSPMGMKNKGYHYNNHFQVGYFVGYFSDNQFVAETAFRELDNGLDLYAPQTYAGVKKRIMLAWFSMPETLIPEQQDNWASCLTLPRELKLDEYGKLKQLPIVDLKSLRGEKISLNDLFICHQTLNLSLDCQSCEIMFSFDLKNSDAECFGLIIAHDENSGQGIELYIDRQSKRLYLDRRQTDFNLKGLRSISIADYEQLDIDLFIDKSSCEIFVNQGEYALSCRFYINSADKTISFFAENGRASFTHITHWKINNTWLPYYPNR